MSIIEQKCKEKGKTYRPKKVIAKVLSESEIYGLKIIQMSMSSIKE